MSLVDLLAVLEQQDEELEKQAAEDDAAGRIMARGFMDELNKLAQMPMPPIPKIEKRKTIPPSRYETKSPKAPPRTLELKISREPAMPPPPKKVHTKPTAM